MAPLPEPMLDTSFLDLEPIGTTRVEKTPQFAPNVHRLEEEELFSMQAEDLLLVARPARIYETNDIVVGWNTDTRRGFARRVMVVTNLGIEGLALEVEPITLAEMTEGGTLEFVTTPDWSDSTNLVSKLGAPKSAKQGVAPAGSGQLQMDADGTIRIRDHVLFDNSVQYEGTIHGVDLEAGQEFKVTLRDAWIRMFPTMRVEVDFGFLKVNTANVTFDLAFEYGVIIDVEADLTGGIHFSHDFLDAEHHIVVMVGPVPVWVTLELRVPLEFNATASLTGEATCEYSTRRSIEVGLEYVNGSGLNVTQTSDELTDTKDVSLSASGSLDANLSILPRVTCKLYDMLGPYLYVGPEVGVDLAYPWPANTPDLYYRLTAGAGLDVTLPAWDTVLFSGGTDFVLFDGGWFDIVGPKGSQPPPNEAPRAYDGSASFGRHGGQVSLNASDPDGDSLLYRIDDAPDSGRLSGHDSRRGEVRYIPEPGFFGSDDFTWSAWDGHVWSESARVEVTVSPGDPPDAVFTLDRDGTEIEVDASSSRDDYDPLRDLQFRWDWTNDGTWDTSWSSDWSRSHDFGDLAMHVVKLEVRNTAGLTSIARVTAPEVVIEDPGGGGGDDDDDDCYSNLPSPTLTYQSAEEETVNGYDITRYWIGVTNHSSFPDGLFTAAPDLPPCGLNTNASRTWVYIYDSNGRYIYGYCGFNRSSWMQSIWFAVLDGETPPDGVYVVIWDRECNQTWTSNTISIP